MRNILSCSVALVLTGAFAWCEERKQIDNPKTIVVEEKFSKEIAKAVESHKLARKRAGVPRIKPSRE